MNDKYYIFTDIDLDGICSYLTCSWYHGTKIPYTACRVNDIEKEVNNFLNRRDITKYTGVYFMDLDITQYDFLPKVDKPNVHIYDHHTTHIENIDKYKFAQVMVEDYTSTCRLFYNKNSKLKETLTPEQKLLILMADDYDSYKFNVPNSYELNVLLWSLTGDRFGKFEEMFNDGFTGFNDQQQNIIQFYKNKLEKLKSTLEVYQADIPVRDTKYNVISTFANTCINDVADYIIDEYDADIGIVINTSSQKVSFRKNSACDIDLSKFSKSVCDEAGGHTDAAGGMICNKFLNFTKIFKNV